MKSFQVFSIVAMITAVVGCSGGGRNNIPGRQCPLNFKPIDLNFKANQKTWEKGTNESSIPVGTYAYQGSSLLYTEKGTNGLVVFLEDVGDRAGVFKTRINCVRNAMNLNAKTSVAAGIVSKIVAAAGAKLDAEAKEVSFRVSDGRLISESKASPKPESLEKAYPEKLEQLFMIQTFTKTDYEVRSVVGTNDGNYVVSVKFKKIQ